MSFAGAHRDKLSSLGEQLMQHPKFIPVHKPLPSLESCSCVQAPRLADKRCGRIRSDIVLSGQGRTQTNEDLSR